MTLSDLIAKKPDDMRLGQHFHRYIAKALFGDYFFMSSSVLNTTCDPEEAISLMIDIMSHYGWKEVPEIQRGLYYANAKPIAS